MATDPEYRWHQEWIGFLQPEGLVVSPPALCAAQAHVNRNIAPVQQVLIDLVRIEPHDFRGGADGTTCEHADELGLQLHVAVGTGALPRDRRLRGPGHVAGAHEAAAFDRDFLL